MSVIVVSTSTYPDSGSSRTLSDALHEIAEHEGGSSSNAQLAKAQRCYDAAVRDFNSTMWKFNVVSEDITLSGGTSEYTLTARVKQPLRMQLLDSNSVERDIVRYFPFNEWTLKEGDQLGTTGLPRAYTIENLHETGQVRFHPRLASSLVYSTARLYYLRFISRVTNLSSRLNVPEDVEEAIMQLATAKFIAKVRTHAEAAAAYRLAEDLRLDVEMEHRIHGDLAVYEDPY